MNTLDTGFELIPSDNSKLRCNPCSGFADEHLPVIISRRGIYTHVKSRTHLQAVENLQSEQPSIPDISHSEYDIAMTALLQPNFAIRTDTARRSQDVSDRPGITQSLEAYDGNLYDENGSEVFFETGRDQFDSDWHQRQHIIKDMEDFDIWMDDEVELEQAEDDSTVPNISALLHQLGKLFDNLILQLAVYFIFRNYRRD